MTKGFEHFTTGSDLESFDDVKSYITKTRREVTELRLSKEVNTFGYQLPGLSDFASFDAQMAKIEHVLCIMEKLSSPQLLVGSYWCTS